MFISRLLKFLGTFALIMSSLNGSSPPKGDSSRSPREFRLLREDSSFKSFSSNSFRHSISSLRFRSASRCRSSSCSSCSKRPWWLWTSPISSVAWGGPSFPDSRPSEEFTFGFLSQRCLLYAGRWFLCEGSGLRHYFWYLDFLVRNQTLYDHLLPQPPQPSSKQPRHRRLLRVLLIVPLLSASRSSSKPQIHRRNPPPRRRKKVALWRRRREGLPVVVSSCSLSAECFTSIAHEIEDGMLGSSPLVSTRNNLSLARGDGIPV
ncbi:hypothetical protein AHAS_Ahas05G0001600 [Arachis hypogaea]